MDHPASHSITFQNIAINHGFTALRASTISLICIRLEQATRPESSNEVPKHPTNRQSIATTANGTRYLCDNTNTRQSHEFLSAEIPASHLNIYVNFRPQSLSDYHTIANMAVATHRSGSFAMPSLPSIADLDSLARSEERRVGKECPV